MTSEGSDFVPVIQVEKNHYSEGYDNRGRWSSYFLQIEQIMKFSPSTVLEVGPGNGVVCHYLRTVKNVDVTTVDIDSSVCPDIIADVASLPFDDNAFDCVTICEVLEHVPFDHAIKGLRELRRVGKRCVLSVPNANRAYVQGHVSVGNQRRRLFGLNLSRIAGKLAKRKMIDQHYWEIGMAGVDTDVLLSAFQECGWKLTSHFRNEDYPYHHFFVLE